ncbi:thioredoxin family protein [Janibacter limosus]|uniref:thioredoxin family protein n=1 Tax=Janibacter limosus TaxID=53458 RepID=UPI0035DD4F59
MPSCWSTSGPPGCGPCRSFAPVFEAASTEHPDILFAKVDTEARASPAAAAQITSIPTLMGFKDGVPVYSQPGALPAKALHDLIGKIHDLDMDHVRAQMQASDPR